MKKNSKIAMFEEKRIRRHWDPDQEKWYFSVVDVVAALTISANPRKYWNKLAESLFGKFNTFRQFLFFVA